MKRTLTVCLMALMALAAAYPAGSVVAQDVTAAPTFGTLTLSAGFQPDPAVVSLISGGGINVGSFSSCRGYIASPPDVRLYYTAGSLPLAISVNSASDTTLVVNAPDGNWYCDDDSGSGTNPSLTFGSPFSGRYEIWVGTYSSASLANANLYISELYTQ